MLNFSEAFVSVSPPVVTAMRSACHVDSGMRGEGMVEQ
jgi:hypothetical protein